MMEFESISKLWKLLSNECKIEKIYPSVFASDAETNIVTGESNFEVSMLSSNYLQGVSTLAYI